MDEGIALNELYSITLKNGFHIVAAGSFIAEHSFSTKELLIGKGRPTEEELKLAEDFGRKIRDKLDKSSRTNCFPIMIPQCKLSLFGRLLPENVTRMLTKPPAADLDKCNKCGLCVKHCPMAAINYDNLEIDEGQCIRCFSCVKYCSKGARAIIYKKKPIITRFFIKK